MHPARLHQDALPCAIDTAIGSFKSPLHLDTAVSLALLFRDMTNAMEQSPLWKRTFLESQADPRVSKLITSLRSARKRARLLTSRIAASLPGLTIHDISHLDALWQVASTIAGDDYALNPLEGYLFGTAVLLHDAALCHEAYTGGLDAVRETTQWKDARERRLANQGSVDPADADFEALRNLHAQQAAAFASKSWKVDEEEPWYIIDDADLRTEYGTLIGKIASSHHWDIEDVASAFAVPRPPASFLDPDWSADSLTVACLLRAADAGHMNSARAPTFLLKILQMNSVSRQHWIAQNHLGHLSYKEEDPTQLVVASTSPFPRAEASAWWVAFDLIDQLDRELKRCDATLRDAVGAVRQPFARSAVAGASDPKELAKYVQTTGWEPTNSSVHVSDVASLVGKLGGEQLYGTGADRLSIALRELIQNASDAISARRLVDEATFQGSILVRMYRDPATGRQVLKVDDNGVGMSSKTLSTDLLDFGKSFWASERASREFPGLHAAKHAPKGQFGIGFFSIFMAADKVEVFSRRFDTGLSDVRCLSFDNGLSLRPVLSSRRPKEIGMNVSTRVRLELKSLARFDHHRIKIPCNILGQEPFFVSFMDYLASLVAGVDVSISLELDGVKTKVHEGFPPPKDRRSQWIRSLSYVPARVNAPADQIADSVSERLTEIRDGETCYGLAALRIDRPAPHDFLTAKAVGGFVNHDPQGAFVGLIEHLPSSAKREPGEAAVPREALDRWLSEQVSLLPAGMTPQQNILACYSLCHFGYDPIDVLAGIFVIGPQGPHFVCLSELCTLLRSDNRLAFRLASIGRGKFLETLGEQHTLPGVLTCHVMYTGSFNDAEMTPNGPKKPDSLVGIVHRTLVNQGAKPEWTTSSNVYTGPFGRCGCLEVHI